MEMRELEGYEEAIKKILKALPAELLVAELTPEQVLSRYKPEQRLTDLPPEQTVLALPVEVLRGFTPDYIASLPEAIRTEVEKRLGRSPA